MDSTTVVTADDPADINPGIIVKSLGETGLAGAPVVVVGYVYTLRRIVMMNITPQAELCVIRKVYDTHLTPGVINMIDKPLTNSDALTPGVVQAATGGLAYRHVKRAAALTLSGEVKAIATAPLNEGALHLGGHSYPRHVESLAYLTGGKGYAMILYTDKLKAVHISTHILLHKFLDTLNDERVKMVIQVTNHLLRRVGIERPRIVVAGVDPCARRHGLLGTEEIEIIAPIIETMQAEDIDATGSCPPDTVSMQCHEELLDMVVAMYHDQGHILLKLFGFYGGVNITTGLPFIRTSADRGTAFNIAWTGKARPESMTVSTQLTIQISQE